MSHDKKSSGDQLKSPVEEAVAASSAVPPISIIVSFSALTVGISFTIIELVVVEIAPKALVTVKEMVYVPT